MMETFNDLRKVRRVPNLLAGYGDERSQTLPDEDLEHPLVQAGEEAR
jgi:hypothetical protein